MLPPNTFTITAVSTKLEIIINDPEIPGNINHFCNSCETIKMKYNIYSSVHVTRPIKKITK